MRSRSHVTAGHPSVRLSVPSVDHSVQQRAAGLLLGAPRAADIESAACAQPSSNGAAARRSAANAGSVAFTADVGD